jgi:hypothetical protein
MGTKQSSMSDKVAAWSRPLRERVRSWRAGLGWAVTYGREGRPRPPIKFVPGYYSSPIPSTADIAEYRRSAGEIKTEIPAVDLGRQRQLDLIHQLAPSIRAQPFGRQADTRLRYQFDNIWYSGFDPVILYALLRHCEPRRIIEVGSGWSTAAILDTYEDRELPQITLIDPNPERLLSVLRPDDLSRVTLLRHQLQDVPLEQFDDLEPNDLLFVDSSHVAKVASDVNRLFFEVLPRIAPGVVVHVHDIGYPFEYRPEFVEAGYGWNEAYLLRAFLEFNEAFEIFLWNDMHADFLRAEFADVASHFPGAFEGAVWLRRIA